jgi:intergrase/recombinase
MSIDSGQLITIGTFVATQALTLVYTIATLRGDGRVMKANLDNLQKEIAGVQETLKALADVRGDMRLIQERGLAQAQRMDEMQRWVNQQRDRSETREH